MSEVAAELVTVRIVGLPLAVHRRAQQHGEAMRREFFLILEQEHARPGSVPDRLLELSQSLAGRYAGFTDEQETAIETAIDAGVEVMDDLLFMLPADVAGAVDELEAVLDEADAWCRSGGLLTLATPDDLVEYRRWDLDNFRRQVAGGAPQPWVGATR